MTEREQDILCNLLVNLFLQSPRKADLVQEQQSIEDIQKNNEQEINYHDQESQEE